MEDYVNTGAATKGPANPFSYDAIVAKKQNEEISNQTSGGSMMGMNQAAKDAMKKSGKTMPTAKEVATDNKVFNQVGDERKPLWQPPKPKQGIVSGKVKVPAASTTANSEAEVGTQMSQGKMGVEAEGKEAIDDFSDINNLPDDDKADFASSQAAIDEAAKSNDPQEQKDVADNYFNKADEELQKKADSKWQLWATIASIALFAFSGGTIPPINFVKFTGQDDAREKWNTLLQEKSEWESKLPSEVRGAAEAGDIKKENQESFTSGTEAATELSAAEQGKGSELGAKEKATDYQWWEKEFKMEREAAKEMAKLQDELQTNSQLRILDKSSQLTQEEMKLEAEIVANAYKKQMEALGYPATSDGFVKFIRATVGDTDYTVNAKIWSGAINNVIGGAERIAKGAMGL